MWDIASLREMNLDAQGSCSFNSITIPHSEDPRHGALIKRCESCKPMGIFRSGENEFFLCYDGKSASGFRKRNQTQVGIQNLVCTWTDMENLAASLVLSNGREQRNVSPTMHHTFLSLILASSRYGTSKKGSLCKFYLVPTCTARGMGGAIL